VYSKERRGRMIIKYGRVLAGRQWLTLVILATQKAEIGRIEVQSQPRQIVLKDSISKKPFTKKGWWNG
jgi:hypothetical protein